MSCPHNHHQKTGYPKNWVFFFVWKSCVSVDLTGFPQKTNCTIFWETLFTTLSKSGGAVGSGLRSFLGSFSCSYRREVILLIVDAKIAGQIFWSDQNLTKANVGAPRALNAIMYIVQLLAKAIFKTIASHWHLTCSHFLIQEGRWMPILRDPKSLPQM